GKSAERLISANVGSRLFAANVLLARSQGENKATAAFEVGGLASESSRHWGDKPLTGSDHADKRAAIAGRQAKALPFHRNDVGFRGRPQSSQRNPFGNSDDQQRACS